MITSPDILQDADGSGAFPSEVGSVQRVRHVLEMDRFIDVTIGAVHERERMVSVGSLSTFTICFFFFSEIRFKKFLESFLWVIKRSDKEKTPFFQRGCEE